MSFWGNKFATQAPTRPPANVPGHLLPQGLPQTRQGPPVYGAPGGAAQPPAPSQEAYEGWQPNTVSPTKMEEVLPIWHWEGNPRGGAGETATLGNCPECGSPRYFSRSSESKLNVTGQMVPPAAECFDCGYPRQQGALGSAAVTGAAHAARQGTAALPPGSIATLSSSP